MSEQNSSAPVAGNKQPEPQGTVVEPKPVAPAPQNDFNADEPQPSLAAEFLDFLVHNKAWWLTPIILVLLMVGTLVVLASTGAAPFIYAIF